MNWSCDDGSRWQLVSLGWSLYSRSFRHATDMEPLEEWHHKSGRVVVLHPTTSREGGPMSIADFAKIERVLEVCP